MTQALDYRRPSRTGFARSGRNKGHTVHLVSESGAMQLTICRKPIETTQVNLTHAMCEDCMALVKEPVI